MKQHSPQTTAPTASPVLRSPVDAGAPEHSNQHRQAQLRARRPAPPPPDGNGAPPNGDPSGAPDGALDAIRASAGQFLADGVADQLSSQLGHDFSHVQVHTDGAAADAATALGAEAFALGQDVFFGQGKYNPDSPSGKALLAHELTHVVQQDEGRLPSTGGGFSVSDPGDAVEREASREAARVATAPTGEARQTAPRARAPTPVTGGSISRSALAGTALREASPTTTETTETTQATAPSSVMLSIAGVALSGAVPSGASPGVVSLSVNSSIAGVTISSVQVTLDEQYQVMSGTMQVQVSPGGTVAAISTSLSIGAGGTVEASISGVAVTLGDYATGTLDLSLGADGVSGSGTIDAASVRLGAGLSATSGSLAVSLDTAGNLAAQGSLSGRIEGIGDWTLQATSAGDLLSGTLTVVVDPGLQPAPGLSVVQGSVVGAYATEACIVAGEISVQVAELATGTVNASYDLLTGIWSGTGTLDQSGTHTLPSGIELHSGTLEVSVLDNVLQPARALVGFSAQGFEGQIEGTWDLNAGRVDGRGDASLTQDLPLGEQLLVRQLQGTATIADNALTTLQGQMTGDLSIPGAPAMQLTFSDGLLDVAAMQTSGQATLTTQEEWTLGAEGGPRLRIATGAVATARVEANTVQEITGDLAFTAADAEGDLGQGSASVQCAGSMETLSAQATFQLTVEYGLNGRADRTVYLRPGGQFTARYEAGTVADVQATEVPFTAMNPSGQGRIDGTFSGGLDLATGLAGGTVAGTLAEEWPIAVEFGELAFTPGGTATLTVDQSQLTGAQVELPLRSLVQGEVPLSFEGTIAGDLDMQTGTVNGECALTLVEEARYALEGGDEIVVSAGSSATMPVVENTVQTVGLDAQGVYVQQGSDFANGTLTGDISTATGAYTGLASLQLLADQPLAADGGSEGGGESISGWAMSMLAGSTLGANLVEGVVQSTDVQASIGFDADGARIAEGMATGTYALGGEASEGFTGTVAAALVQRVPWTEGERFEVMLDLGTTINTQVEANQLLSAEGSFTLMALEEGVDCIRTVISSSWAPGATLSGTGTAEVLSELLLWEGGSEALYLSPGSTGSGTIEQDQLTFVEGQLLVRFDEEGAPLAEGTLDLACDLSQGQQAAVNGEATLTTVRDLPLEAVGDYSFTLESGATGTATLVESRLTTMNGTMPVRMDDGEGELARVQLAGLVDREQNLVNGAGAAEVLREKQIGESGDFTVWLSPGSGGTFTVDQGALTAIDGDIQTRVDLEGAPFAEVLVSGNWTEATGLSGQGQATMLVDEYEAAEMGAYTLYIVQGAGAQVTLASNQIESMTADIPMAVRRGGTDFMQGNLNGTYLFQDRMFSGGGTVEVVGEQQLAEMNGDSFWLVAGSGAEVQVASNEVTHIGGALNLSLRDGEEYLLVQFAGDLDLAAETPLFTGGGAATVTREKTLFESGDYAFALDPGAGAQATITENRITSVDGEVPFRVYSAGQALLFGSVAGNWNAETGMLNGSGSVELALDQTYGPVRILAGSGGTGDVVDSQLTRVEGALLAELSDADGPLVSMSAQGEFDALENMIRRMEGEASLLRPIEPLPGFVISDVTGSGRIEENEVREVEGSGRIAVEAVDLTGDFTAGWRNDGGEDVYWGEAQGTLDMARDMATPGRGIETVSLSAALHEDQTFDLSGDLTYSLTDRIGGALGVEMDETLDPVLSGTIDAEGELMEGKELFKWEKDLISGTVMAGPIPVGYGVKGAVGMDMNPMGYNTSFGVSDFHILDVDVPDFNADLALDWGLNFFARIAPYVGVGANFGDVLTALAGLRGQAQIDVPVEVGVIGTLQGSDGEFSGELGVGASIVPSATLSLDPFVELTAFGQGAEGSFTAFSHTFDDLFSVEWNKTYSFGDQPEAPSEGAEVAMSNAPGPTSTGSLYRAEETSAPDLGVGNAVSGRSGPAGAPAVGGEDIESGEAEGGDFAHFDSMKEKLDVVSDGVSGVKTIIGLVGLNPLGSLVDVITHFDEVQTAIADVTSAVALAGQLLIDLLPDWWEELTEMVEQGIDFIADAAGVVWDGAKWVAGGVADAAEATWDGVTWVAGGAADLAGDGLDAIGGGLSTVGGWIGL